jgi:hypothetical protein
MNIVLSCHTPTSRCASHGCPCACRNSSQARAARELLQKLTLVIEQVRHRGCCDFSTTPFWRRPTYGRARIELFGQVVGAAIMTFALADVCLTILYARVGRGRVERLGAGFIVLAITSCLGCIRRLAMKAGVKPEVPSFLQDRRAQQY